jgi:DNA-binding transcriptional MerR regulator
MEQATLETRPLYGIGTVARLTGLKPDTLRVWERRYGLGASRKSETGRRQYTQADLEHLQLVAALIESGSRIGEIASSDRKTLEMLCRRQAGKTALPPSKARVLFLGPNLCHWIDDHQGCLANVDASLSRQNLNEVDAENPGVEGPLDALVVECSTVSGPQLERVAALAETLEPARILIASRFHNEQWLRELEAREMTALELPPDPARLVFEIARTMAEKETAAGNVDLGELVAVKPREFSPEELSAARSLRSTLECECPRHISDLIGALADFEDYSAGCSVENWQDAAVHACIYAYAGQARWLMERALNAVLEERGDEFRQQLEREKRLQAS